MDRFIRILGVGYGPVNIHYALQHRPIMVHPAQDFVLAWINQYGFLFGKKSKCFTTLHCMFSNSSIVTDEGIVRPKCLGIINYKQMHRPIGECTVANLEPISPLILILPTLFGTAEWTLNYTINPKSSFLLVPGHNSLLDIHVTMWLMSYYE